MDIHDKWHKKQVLITVRTYPTPPKTVIEASCTAGICDGKWIRLFPVPSRLLDNDKRFRKYQVIEVDAVKASDPRPESYKIDIGSIKILSEPMPTTNNWQFRKEKVMPLSSRSLCSLYKEQQQNGSPTLGFFKPGEISKLVIQKSRTAWTASQEASLLQSPMFGKLPKIPLQKIPYDFFYEFRCDNPDCPTHRLMCTDWEMGESFLKWTKKYNDNWEEKYRARYETDIIQNKDTCFYVGTVHGHPHRWIIIGLFYPPKRKDYRQASLFELP